ncbi:MAG: PAS domain S-box protein [Microcoleus vaginatus WJT46-NPBG5]|jgi:PAS domain S-box-containing protein|nr:PAS domain S-box protein [Microcoleus vaginatus WJT46-NPBG5]
MKELERQTASQTAEEATVERGIAEAREHFLELVQGLDAIVWEMDAATWKFTFVSDRAEAILGYLISAWYEEPDFWQNRLLHPEDRNGCIELFMCAINEGLDRQLQYRAIAADGRTVWLKDCLQVVRDKSGCVKLLRGVAINITQEKLTEEENQQLLQERAARVEVEKVQEALCKSEERYRRLVEAISQIIWDTKAEGEFVNPQPGWSAFTGQSFEELRGWGWLNAIHPDDQAHTAAVWGAALASRTLYEVEHRLRRYDGEYRDMSVRAVPVLEADGSVREWVGVHTDITDRKRVETALKESEHRYAQILDSLQDMVFCKAANSVVVYANKAACNYYGMTQEELRGVTDVPFNKLDYTQQYLKDDLQVFTTGQPVEILEEPNVRADGQTRFFHTIKCPIFDTNGNVVEIVGVSRDITDRKQEGEVRDRALAEAEAARAELQRVFMQAPAAIATTRGPNHITETLNPLYRQILGNRNIIGKPIREALPDLEGQGFFELLDQVYATGIAFVGNEMPSVFDRKGDGVLEESFWNFVYQPLFNADNQVYGIMAHAVEVTDQVRARQEIEKKAEELARLSEALERSNKELEQFAYVTSHDLKAPLRGIASLSEWIEEDLAEHLTRESREHMILLRGRVHRMEALIEGILQYSRAGRLQLIETVNVGNLLSGAIDLLAPPPEAKIIVEPEMPILKTERVPLQQVFMNLINNAIKHARRHDICVRVGGHKVGKYYEFYVSDNGPGIAPEYHQKIWVIFQRLESRDKHEGTGIGLSVVKKIIESRGGKVWIQSEVGAGATFYFTWPKDLSGKL